MISKMHFPTLSAVMLAAVILSGCGIAPSSQRDVDAKPATSPPSSRPGDERDSPGGIPAAARNRPLAGESVVQSSNGANGVTTDDISVQVSYRPEGSVRYRVRNGDEWLLGGDDPETETIANRRGRLPAGGSTATGVLAAKGSSERTGDAAERMDDGLSLVMYTDIESAADADHLVWGVWVDAPGNATAHHGIVHGAFGFGSDSFSHHRREALAGTARFQGDVAGMYFEPGEQPLGGFSFEARVALQATFGDDGALVSIGGVLDSFRLQTNADGARESRPEMMVTLEGTDIGVAGSGFLEGTSTGSHHDGTPLSGRWGGRVHGNSESDGKPGSITGTFGSVNGNRGLIGAFGARRQ